MISNTWFETAPNIHVCWIMFEEQTVLTLKVVQEGSRFRPIVCAAYNERRFKETYETLAEAKAAVLTNAQDLLSGGLLTVNKLLSEVLGLTTPKATE